MRTLNKQRASTIISVMALLMSQFLQPGPAGAQTVIHSFASTEGATPPAALIVGKDSGLLYGVTTYGPYGATNDNGIVFQVNQVSGGGFSSASTITTLHVFAPGVTNIPYASGGTGPDGANPVGRLLEDGEVDNLSGVPYYPILYGTTEAGGQDGDGTVFQLMPDTSGNYTETILHSFTGATTDGKSPEAGLTLGADGKLHGTAATAGAAGGGVIFELATNGTGYRLVNSFLEPYGDQPKTALVLASDNHLYGVTAADGITAQSDEYGYGTLYELDLSRPSVTYENAASGTFTLSFGLTATSALAYDATAAQVQAALNMAGVLPAGVTATVTKSTVSNPPANTVTRTTYSITLSGGTPPYPLMTTTSSLKEADGDAVKAYTSEVTSLHTFLGGLSDGLNPLGDLIQASDGDLYGTTLNGGMFGNGTVFQCTLPGSGGSTIALIHSFETLDGGLPFAGVIQGTDGNLYGTTGQRGNPFCTPAGASGCPEPGGTIFQIQSQSGTFTGGSPEVVLQSFGITSGASPNAPDGKYPNAAVVQDGSYVYATTQYGGANDFGVIFQQSITDPPAPTVATAASASPNPTTTNTTSLSVLGAYTGTGGEPALTYTWTCTSAPAGVILPTGVTFSANNTNAAKNTTVTFNTDNIVSNCPASGTYVFTVTIANPANETATSSVTVTVNPTATSVVVSPGPSVWLGPTLPQSQQFTGVVYDQFATELCTQPTIQWTVASGVGSINGSTGLYNTGSTPGQAVVEAEVFSGATLLASGTSDVTAGSLTSAPTNLTATASGVQVALAWTAVAGATGYSVYRGTVSGGENYTSPIATVSTPSYIDTSVSPGITYYYTVTTYNGEPGPPSNEAAVTAAPQAPQSLTATGGVGYVALSWTAGTGDGRYRVYRGTASGGESGTAIKTGITATSFTDTDVTDGVTYYYYVKSVSYDNGPLSSASNQTSGQAQNAGATNVRTPGRSGQVALSWSASTGDNLYRVYRGTSPGGETTAAIKEGLTTTTYTDTTVTNGITYYYDVKALYAADEATSPASNEASATP